MGSALSGLTAYGSCLYFCRRVSDEGETELCIYDIRTKALTSVPATQDGYTPMWVTFQDGKMLVEYLRCNMRVAAMPSQKDVCVQTIRARVARGFAKLTERLDAIYAVEGYDILDMFHKLIARIQEVALPEPQKPGRKPKPTLENEYKQAMAALERMKSLEKNDETASQ